MNEFVRRHAACVTGCLSGFDRLLFRGTIRLLASASGLMSYLWASRVLLKDFGDWSAALTDRVRSASERVMRDAGRPVLYLPDPSASKEDLARSIAKRDRIEQGQSSRPDGLPRVAAQSAPRRNSTARVVRRTTGLPGTARPTGRRTFRGDPGAPAPSTGS